MPSLLRRTLGAATIFLTMAACGPFMPARADVSANPNTRLMQAIWQHDHDGVSAALNQGATPNYVAPFSEFKTDFSGSGWADHRDRLTSALGLAARLADLATMTQLIDAGADINLHARADDSNLPATNRHVDVPRGPSSGLDMTKFLIQRGYRPTAQDITSAIDLRRTIGWEEWSAVVLDVPGVARRINTIQAGMDPEYQKLEAERAAEQDLAHQAETEAFGRQLQAAQQSAQATLEGSSQVITGAGVGQMVCSKVGVYRTKYVAYVEARNDDRVELKILGGFKGTVNDFRPNEVRWDNIENWVPCTVH